MNEKLYIFEEKIEEYYLSCMPQISLMQDKSFLVEWPLYKFSICRLYEALVNKTSVAIHNSIADKLIDIKLHFTYLLTVNDHFDRGPTLIVGNHEIDKLNPNTISLLRGTHYRVYLLSILIEQILDILWLITEGAVSNFKKDKWNKIIVKIQSCTKESIITNADANLFNSFKSQYRTAEMHKFSMVRAMTGKDKWNHLQEEENLVSTVIGRIYAYYMQT